ncbi:MAG TPA: NADH:ubiquinone reductase (Na(+)-transporting) subunit C [Bacteroidales bacterium]|jgi:Na+-transporting NADH:ubiquinone oxidoreductase subunit C|nr:NADH:ubiquinone reductase (Na(+)-transporting) subunit C [Bacteroidales bacterium]HOF45251.1 NADH:ubiquinone reductase (Na(+)-transporting) subunit C [Bacteroidales bacterium]HOS58057.1 NADH:ubiquinone reductase (Na(+)-transporting) subunit C [Bacteroidales bacterium]HRR03745.1 NADH:ubiquinone reductase (Na(+)-transporting) subunit C [Bacteroidales bacterium]
MKKFSNRYIFIYITVLVVLISLILGIATFWLKPFQKINQENEKKMQILKTVGYTFASKEETAKMFKQVATQIQLPTGSQFLYQVITPKQDTAFVIPLKGNGLWGAIWGYIAVADDGNHVIGAVFAHKGETPGLGAQIATDEFSAEFKGKQLFDENGNFTSIKVVKGGVLNSKIPAEHGVDAITGGTITSRGVEEMLEQSLTPYISFLKGGKNNQ